MMTLEEFTTKKEEFLIFLDVEKNLALNTQRAYFGDLKQFTQFWAKINTAEKNIHIFSAIERFLVSLYNKKINKSSIARKLSCLKSFEKYVQTDGISLNLNLKRPKIDKKLPVYLTIDEMLHLLDNVKTSDLPSKFPLRDKAILELLYATGIRCSELINIKLKDINSEQKTILIYGKGRKERIVLFGSKAHEKLLQHLLHERQKTKTTDEYLFLNHRGGQLTSRSVQRIIQMFRQFLKIDKFISPHKIRHSFATHLINQGVDIRIVQELLGHKNIASTEKYTHVSQEHLAKLFDTIHPLHTILKRKDD
ncbi:tyrosine-type recombinase/integrase [bacterium]|jgi:integrase/recombinase XerC|nr:tyrosine-type recombinase/integrase [bacterium]